jgi:type III secretion protein U
MSEGGEKTEQPTPKKLRDAREKGQVSKSQEVVISGTLFGLIAYVFVKSDDIVLRLMSSFTLPSYRDGEFSSIAVNRTQELFSLVSDILLPVMALVIVLAIATNVMQFGFMISGDSIVPKLEKISPMAGFKRIFSMKHVVETLKNILKIIILSTLLYIVLKEQIFALLQSIHCGVGCIGHLTGSILATIFSYSAVAFFVIAGFDFMYQRHTHTKSLMMSKDEIKREYKESEGDPHIKGQRRQFAHELAMGDPGVVKKSSAVVVNPTHYAVAILFDKERAPLPMAVAKGTDREAAIIREEAEKNGVPIFSHPPLARRLFADAPLYEPIPTEFFESLAEILVWIENNRSELYRGEPLNHGVIELQIDQDRRLF